jgi:FixJ family two-component response regulator
MARMINVYIHSTGETKVVTLSEAEAILEEHYNDPEGCIILDVSTQRAIAHIGPDIEGIIIMEQMLGTG